MKPFFDVIREEYKNVFLLEQNDLVKTTYGLSHVCPNIISDDSHIIQTHTISLGMFVSFLRVFILFAIKLHIPNV